MRMDFWKNAFLIVLTISLALEVRSFAANPAGRPAQEIKMKRIDVEEFDKLRQQKDAIVVDVRTEKEFKASRIPGAVNIDVNAKDFEAQVGKLGTNKVLLLHCTAGVRSRRAAQKLNAAGFENLYDLAPGMSGWEKAGKPVEK